MSEQDLSSTVTELMAQLARMQAELDSLKARAQVLTQPTIRAKPEVSTTRRKLLRRLAGGLVASLAIGGIEASLPQTAEAKFVSAKGWGAIVVPPGGTIAGSTPPGTVYGLYATSDLTTNISDYLPNTKIGVIGLITTTTSGSTYYGVFGQAKDYGVYGNTTDGIGVYGFSKNNSGVIAQSDTGAPFRIVPGAQPPAVEREVGDMYVDIHGQLYIWVGPYWRIVAYL